MKRLIIAACAALLSACATHYTTPAAGVSLAAIAETDVEKSIPAKHQSAAIVVGKGLVDRE